MFSKPMFNPAGENDDTLKEHRSNRHRVGEYFYADEDTI